jgi:hypothetical protein
MKKLILLVGLVVSVNAFSQSSVYLGQDENNYPIYKNVKPFSNLSARIGISVVTSGISAFIIHVFVDRKKEKEQAEKEPLLQENVEI